MDSIVRALHNCEEFIAGDRTILRELLHPDKAEVSIRYSLAHAVVRPGESSQPHRMKTSEVYYILSGEGIIHIDDETSPVRADIAVYIPPRATQYIYNSGTSELKFLCIVDPAWRSEDEEVL